jgi:hypothetical protein
VRRVTKTISVCGSVFGLTTRCDVNYSPLCIDHIDPREGNDFVAYISRSVVAWPASLVWRISRRTAAVIPRHRDTILRHFSSLHISTLFDVRLICFQYYRQSLPVVIDWNSVRVSCYRIRGLIFVKTRYVLCQPSVRFSVCRFVGINSSTDLRISFSAAVFPQLVFSYFPDVLYVWKERKRVTALCNFWVPLRI